MLTWYQTFISSLCKQADTIYPVSVYSMYASGMRDNIILSDLID